LNYIIIFVSFLVSTIVSVYFLKTRNHKWLAMLLAFSLNTLILLISTLFLFNIDDEARIFGFVNSNLYVLIFSIPIITWVNLVILVFLKGKDKTKIQ